MTEMTIRELEQNDFYLIGDKDRENYFPAIIGIARDKSHIAYSYEKLAKCFKEENNWSWKEAEEWIDYSIIRALPYYGEKSTCNSSEQFCY